MSKRPNSGYIALLNEQGYARFASEYDVQSLPQTFRKSHDFVVKTTNNFSDWSLYHKSEPIRRTIDLYLAKLAEHLREKAPPKTENLPVKSDRARRAVKKQRPDKQNKTKRSHSQRDVKRVEQIRDEVKFIRRFVALHNKRKLPTAILSLVKSLQRAIAQRIIRKTSPFREEIQMIQDKLVDAYNEAKGDTLDIKISDKDLPRLVSIAGGEQVYPSIQIIKRYIGMQGKELPDSVLGSFLKQIENAIKSQKVANEDPYYDNVKAIQNSVKKLRGGNKLKIAKVALNGLEGIVNSCGCIKSSARRNKQHEKAIGDYNSGVSKYLPGKRAKVHDKGLNGVISAREMAEREFDVLNFTHPWLSLFGKPEKNFSMMFHGEPHAGKSILLLKFAEYLANHFGNVLYVSSEEHDSKTLSKKLDVLMPVKPERLGFWGNIDEPNLSLFDFVIIDSVNDLGLKITDFKRMIKEYPGTGFILVLQHTKAGDYRGGKDWEHLVQIAAEVTKGVVTVYRNRYGVFGSFNFWQYFRTTPAQFQET